MSTLGAASRLRARTDGMGGAIRGVHRDALRYAVGGFCGVVGALMLVDPHQFASTTYATLQFGLPWWGAAFLVASVDMIATTVLTLGRPLVVAGHLLAAAVLVFLALGFASTGGSTGTITYGVLGIGIAVAPLLPPASGARDRDPCLLDLIVAATAILLGVTILAGAGAGSDPNRAVQGFRAEVGVAFLASAAALGAVVVHPPSRLGVWAAHLAAGATYVAFAALVALPSRAWIGFAYYGGFGIAVGTLPWLAPRLRRIDPSSLRTRLTVIFIAVASLPLLLGVSVIADRVEQATISRELRAETTLAATMSRATGDANRSYLAAVSAIADRVDVGTLPAAQQRALLRSLIGTDVTAFSTFDATGRPIARSDDRPLVPLPAALVADIRRRDAASVIVATDPGTRAPELVFAAPVPAPSKQVVGFVAAEVEADSLGVALSRLDPDQGPDSAVFVVDQSGRIVVGPPASADRRSLDPPTSPGVAPLLQSRAPAARRDQSAGRDWLLGYAPVSELGWGVLVEHPTATVLASTYALRDVAFVFLLVVVVLAAASGAILARYVVAPLQGLAVAVERMAEGDPRAPLPTGGVSEVGRLAAEFRTMCDQIAARRAEQERAEAGREQALAREREARRQAEAAVLVRDEFLSIAAHELKTPMASLRLWIQFLQREIERGSDVGPAQLGRALRTVDQQVGRLADLVVQLLEVSRIQLGGFALKRSAANVAELVDEAVQLARMRSDRHELRLAGPAEAWASVDALRLGEVITNLLDNAIKYSPEGGPIDVDLEAISADALRLSVRDRGIGIPPEHRPRVFELFYQAHADSHRSGMGIGLYVARQIVELHGGRIALLVPEDGEGGTRAVVELPTDLDGAPAPARNLQDPSVRTG